RIDRDVFRLKEARQLIRVCERRNLRGEESRNSFFLREVGKGNVAEITSRGTAIQGRFRHPVAPRAEDGVARLFATEIPAFADTNQLSRLLQSKDVSINAVPLDKGVVWWKSLLLGFG